MDSLAQAKFSVGWYRLKLQFLKFPERVRAELNESNQRYAVTAWPKALQEQGPSLAQGRVLTAGAEVRTSTFGVTLRAATSGAVLSGGLRTGAGRKWAGLEFGATPKVVSVVRLGRRRDQLINKQFAPRRTKGKVVYPAARKLGPIQVARWVKAVVKAFASGNPDVKVR